MTWLLEDLHLFASFQHGRDRGSSSPLVPPMPSTWWRRAGVPPIWHPTMRCWSRLLDDVCVVHWAHVFFFFDIIFILLYLLSLPRTILNGEILSEFGLILHSSSHVEVMEHHSNIVPWQYLGCTGVMAIWMSWSTKRISSKAGNTKNWSETEVGWHHWRGAGRIGGKHLWISNVYHSVTQYIPVCKRTAALWHDLEAQKCRESWTWRSSSDFWLPRRNSWPLFTSLTHWVASIRSLGTLLHIAPVNGRRMICYAPMKNTSKCMSLLSL